MTFIRTESSLSRLQQAPPFPLTLYESNTATRSVDLKHASPMTPPSGNLSEEALIEGAYMCERKNQNTFQNERHNNPAEQSVESCYSSISSKDKPKQSGSFRRTKTSISLALARETPESEPSSDSSSSLSSGPRTPPPKEERIPQGKEGWFGTSVRNHTQNAPDTPVFDPQLRKVMEPHISKARRRREISSSQMNSPRSNTGGRNSFSNTIDPPFGVPYPALRKERPFLFDEFGYPLHNDLAQVLGVSDLSQLHLHPIQDKRTLLNPLLDPEARQPFHRSYDHFVNSFCIPLLHSLAMEQDIFHFNSMLNSNLSDAITYRYQAFPCIRIVRPGEFSIGPHCDMAYGHSVHNINFHIPLTPTFGTNALFTESHPGKEDWHPLTTKSLGLGYIFDGARCLHFTMENMTENTRVSLDFRIAISIAPNHVEELNGLDVGMGNKELLEDSFSSSGPGYYEDAVISSQRAGSNYFPGSVVIKKRGNGLMQPDKRVGFPFA